MISLRLNNYEIVSVIGEGGMGTVYLARHTFTGRKAAVKLLHSELARDQSLVTRFMNEARATTAIGHPNIIDIIDVGILPDGHTPYLMMELLQGESLSRRLQRSRPLPIHEAIEIACQTASALSAAHACDIVHRDLKPDNLFLVPDPSMLPMRLRVKVLDFGIAKLRGELSAGSVKTRTGSLLGTPQYMSPEQCRGLVGQVDHRTDIYALGIIVYEMVCGSPPFMSEGLGELLMMHINRSPAPPRTMNADVPKELEAAIMRALAKDPNRRFASMADFQEALRPADRQSAATVPMGGHEQPALADTLNATSLPAVPGPAGTGTALAPTQVSEEKMAASEAAPNGSSSELSSAKAPSTTFTSTVGQVLARDRESTPRRLPRVRRAVLVGGVLVVATLVVYATAQHRGQQPPRPPSAASTAPARFTGTVLPSVAPAPPTAASPDAAPPPPTASAPVVAAEEPVPVSPKDQAHGKKPGKRNAAMAAPTPPSLPKTETPPKTDTPPTLPPASSPAIKPKPGERW